MAHFDVDFLDKNSERYMLSRRIRKITEVIKSDFFVKDSVSTGDFFIRDGQYTFEERNEGEWKPFKAHNDYWGYHECYCWFKQTVTIPESFKGEKVIYQFKPYYNAGNWNQVNPQFIVWINGEMTQGVDSNHQYVTVSECAKGGETLEIYINAYTDPWEYKGQVQMGAFLQTLDKDAVRIYYDIASPLEVTNYYDGDSTVRVDLIKHLNVACNMLDIDSGDRDSFRETAKEASAYLNENIYGKTHEATAWSIGHTHIDVAWLWRLRQTRDKAGRSFATVIKLMEEYPDYKFMSSQAQLYDYVKQDYPELFEKIKQKVKEGRWEVEGSMWVEADTNVASGEALVRQFLVGKKFFKEEFGIDNKIMWLPDVFGYSGAIPQLIKKCGMEYFMTTKISWNEYNKFPYDTFMWKGIDGTEVLSHFSPCEDANRDERKDYQTTYNAYLRPGYIIGGNKRYSQKDLGRDYLCTFGFGDGGGGPTVDMLEHGARMQRGIEGCPNVKIAPSLDFFRHLENQVKDNKYLPLWSGELYLELHRGTLTSQARNKKYNRKTECLFHDVETLSAIAKKETGFGYPAERILENWKLILLNQFHDILPGTCINKAHLESRAQTTALIKEAKEKTAMLIKGNDDNTVTVINTLSFERNDVLFLDIPEGLVVEGRYNQQRYTDLDGKNILLVGGVKVPAFSSVTLNLVEDTENRFNCNFIREGNKLSAPLYEVTLAENGTISEYFDKRAGRQIVSGENFNTLLVAEDVPASWDNWDVDSDYELKFKNASNLVSSEVVSIGRVAYIIRNKYQITANSTVTQDMMFFADSAEIRFDTVIAWNDNHKFLKAAFDTDIFDDFARHEIQFGYAKRPTTRNTSVEQAKFEVLNHKYSDISEARYGFAVLNDCKYGISAKDGSLRLSLHKGGNRPDHEGDRDGLHRCVYSVLPHEGAFGTENVIKPAYMLNIPVIQTKGITEVAPLIKLAADNCIVEAIKPCEDAEKAFIVRVYEAEGAYTKTAVEFSDSMKKVTLTNMLEEEIEEIGTDKKTELIFKPFEIKTLKVYY